METAFAGISGAVIGSFLNVVVYRLPLGQSLVKPRSRCPRCEEQVSPRDNIPLVSWLLRVDDTPDRYAITFHSTSKHSWQRRSLTAMAACAPDVVTIENEPA